MPLFSYGPYQFTFSGATSGYAPTKVQGPGRSMYVIEHQIPAREGGIVEYLGSEQSKYTWKGFLSPSQDGPYNGTAGYLLSGAGYIPQNADDAMNDLFKLRGSGANLLLIESTYSNESGYQRFYENGFFLIEKETFAFEAGHTYPYYPYTIDFKGASQATYGNSSGTSPFLGQGAVNPGIGSGAFDPLSFDPGPTYAFDDGNASGVIYSGGGYLGYVFAWQMQGGTGTPVGQTINTLGLNVLAVASGSIQVAVYSGSISVGTGAVLVAQSAPQAAHSGWNYFPLRPSFKSTSGGVFTLAFMGTSANQSGFVVAMYDANDGLYSYQSGATFGTFPSIMGSGTGSYVSGFHPDIVMVTA